MKVCLVPQLSQLSSSIGGVNRVIHDLAKYLTLAGIEIVDNPTNADIIHCHAVGDCPNPDVYTNHGYWSHPRTPWEIHANTRMTKMIQTAKIVTSPSEWSTKVYKDKLGVNPRVIRNGVDIEKLQAIPKGNALKWLGIDKPYLLFGKNKIQALNQGKALKELAKHTNIPIVATVWPDNDIPANVTVTGLLPYDKMLEAIRDSLALISTTKECFSVQVIEALAMGKPVIGWRHGGTAEVIQNDQNGYLERPGTPLQTNIAYLLNNYSKLSQGASTCALEYDLKTVIIPQYIQAYQDCLDMKRKKSLPIEPKQKAVANDVTVTNDVAVTIVVTCYNLAGVITEAVESALYQKFDKPYEVIVVDDCSTDSSRSVLTKLRKKYPQLKLIFNAKNLNAAPSRNRAIAMAKGEFIVSLDGDDKIHNRFLAELYPVIKADDNIGIAYSDFERFGDYPNLIARTYDWNLDALLRHNYIPCCCLFRKEAWYKAGMYRNLGGWEDYDLWIAISGVGYVGKRVPKVLFYYRQFKNNRAWRSALNSRNLRRMLKEKHPQYIGPSEKEIRNFEIAAGLVKGPSVTIPTVGARIAISIEETVSAANFWGRDTEKPKEYKLLEYMGTRMATEILTGTVSGKKYKYSASHPLFEAKIEDVPGLMKTNWFRESQE